MCKNRNLHDLSFLFLKNIKLPCDDTFQVKVMNAPINYKTLICISSNVTGLHYHMMLALIQKGNIIFSCISFFKSVDYTHEIPQMCYIIHEYIW